MSTKFDIRQCISHDLLDMLATAAGKEVDDLLRSINSSATPPLKLSVTQSDRVVTIGSISVTNPETSVNRTIPTISNTLPNFTSGTTTAPATGSGTIVVSPGTNLGIAMAANQFLKVGINLDAAGNINLTTGTAAGSLSAATAPPGIKNTFGIGYFVLQTDVSNNIANIQRSDLYQYVGGGGGSGSGDANSFLETIKANLREGVWQLATPNIFSISSATHIDGSSTGVFSLVTQNYNLEAAEFLLSTQQLDAGEFLTAGRDVKSVQLMAQWASGYIDTAATYQVTRTGQTADLQTVAMERVGTTDTFVGTLVFATEAADQTLVTQTAAGFDAVLNTTDRQKVGQIFTVATSEAWVVRKSRIYLTKTGAPTGNIFISIVRDAAVPGTPSLVLTDILSETNAILVSGLSTGLNVLSLPDTVLPAGVYHIVVRTDDTYKTQYTSSSGTSNIAVQVDAVATGVEKFDGTIWTASAGADFKQNITGRKLDLRVKITASTTSQLVGTGILYDLQTNGIVGGIKNRQVFAFNSTTNPNSFVLTQFRPDPDLLGVYFIQTGQVFRAPKFYLNGNTVVFPANTFNNGGVPADLTLVFDQSNGTSFDNSDMNALLLAGNFLGSTDPSIDRSANGRGIFLRRPDGTLRELTIDNNDSIVIYSV